MPWWTLVLDAVGIVLGVLLLFGVTLLIRRRVLWQRGARWELSYRARSTNTGRGWLLGLGRYDGESLEWYPLFSLAPRPKRVWNRADVEFVGRREPIGAEQVSLYPGHVVVICQTPGPELELAMSLESLVGFQSWLEAMPPGSRSVRPGDAPNAL